MYIFRTQCSVSWGLRELFLLVRILQIRLTWDPCAPSVVCIHPLGLYEPPLCLEHAYKTLSWIRCAAPCEEFTVQGEFGLLGEVWMPSFLGAS